MPITFFKYEGAGNDFILIDDRDMRFPERDHQLIRRLCDRHFGIGADGLMLLRPSRSKDFKMIYFNADGKEGTMCGNGGRCMVAFSRDIALTEDSREVVFDAVDGKHRGGFTDKNRVSLVMQNVSGIRKSGNGFLVNTGSLHYVEYVDKLVDMDVYGRGKAIREHEAYSPGGCNVNFIEGLDDGTLKIRTYERGVENETLACGTGSVAAAIVYHAGGHKADKYTLIATGGELHVSFERSGKGYENIRLEGPVRFVFKGVIEHE